MTFADLARKNLKFIILFPIVVVVLVVVASLFRQPLYKSSVSLLVVQAQNGDLDARAAVQSAEKMADTLSRVIESRAFRAEVLAAGGVEMTLSSEPWREARQWRKLVKTRNITDTGILVIDVYQPTSEGATNLAATIESSINEHAYGYLGARAESVFIRQLNPPAPTSSRPASPNLPINAAVAWLSGMMVALSLLFLFPNVNWNNFPGLRARRMFPKREKLEVPTSIQSSTGLIYSSKLVDAVQHNEVRLEADSDEHQPPHTPHSSELAQTDFAETKSSENGINQQEWSQPTADESKPDMSTISLVERANMLLSDR